MRPAANSVGKYSLPAESQKISLELSAFMMTLVFPSVQERYFNAVVLHTVEINNVSKWHYDWELTLRTSGSEGTSF